jgi:hypothetical protein
MRAFDAAPGECGGSIMAGDRSSAAAAVRARLNLPVIDSDGHGVEFGPQAAD